MIWFFFNMYVCLFILDFTAFFQNTRSRCFTWVSQSIMELTSAVEPILDRWPTWRSSMGVGLRTTFIYSSIKIMDWSTLLVINVEVSQLLNVRLSNAGTDWVLISGVCMSRGHAELRNYRLSIYQEIINLSSIFWDWFLKQHSYINKRVTTEHVTWLSHHATLEHAQSHLNLNKTNCIFNNIKPFFSWQILVRL
jgi:hypothetical protein